MFINNKMASGIYKLGIAAVCVVSVVLELLSGGRNMLPAFLGFSSVLYGIAFVLFCSQGLYILLNKHDLRTSVLVTAKASLIVSTLGSAAIHFYFMFADQLAADSAFSVASVISHIVLPLALLLDWALFDRKGLMKATVILESLILPAAYLIYLFINYGASSKYALSALAPYPFLGYNSASLTDGAITAGCFALLFAAVAAIIFVADRLLGEAEHRRCCRLQRTKI